MRDALMMELFEDVPYKDGSKSRKIKRLRLVARAMVQSALKGNAVSQKEIFDRVDGKLSQVIKGDTPSGAIPIDITNLTTAQIEKLKERIVADLVAKGRLRPPSPGSAER